MKQIIQQLSVLLYLVFRYEPMTDLGYQKDKDKNKRFFYPTVNSTYPFVKTAAHPAGIGDWPSLSTPSGHSNVYPSTYPYSDPPKTIGAFIADNRFKYRKKGKLGEPDSVLYTADLSQRLKELYKPPKKLNAVTDENAKSTAYNKLGEELKEGTTALAKNYNYTAQTRIVTSYGFAQLMYTLTIDVIGKFNEETGGRYAPTGTPYMDKTNVHQYPEKLNEQNIFMPIYCDFLLRNLHVLLNKTIPSSQWSGTKTVKKGRIVVKTINYSNFETAWKGSLYFYNSAGGYGDSVIQKSQKYLPR